MKKRIMLSRLFNIFSIAILILIWVSSPANAKLTVQKMESLIQDQFGSALGYGYSNNFSMDFFENQSITCPIGFDLLAKAQPDECFYGLCNENNYQTNEFPCPEINGVEGIPKVNHAYIWGMTMADDGKVWFGTMANTHCLVLASYLGFEFGFETSSYACELGSCTANPLGDWRSPKIFSYDPESQNLREHTPNDVGFTLGIRSAGSADGVVFLGGPALSVGDSFVRLFAFLTDGTYLGSINLNEAIDEASLNTKNIRKWLNVDGKLYTAIGSDQGGRVLKWTGTQLDPFKFEVVGELDGGSGAELAYHEGRIFVTTWPGDELAGGTVDLAGLFMSPPVNGGLTADDKDDWEKVWQVDDYEPDPITAATYGGGALASFDGYLFWGTMHVPFLSFAAYSQKYPALSQQESLQAFLGSYRAISIFRGKNFNEVSGPDIDLGYGMPELPVSSEVNGTLIWSLESNKMNRLPLFGLSGFGNIFNNYTWSMQVFKDKLWIGTMDWSYLLGEFLEPELKDFIEQQIGGPIPNVLSFLTKSLYGGDLFSMDSSQKPAFPLCLSGLGNYLNYGIRNMVVSEDKIYFGMANPMNLLTDATDDEPEGGWELLARGDLPVDGDLIPPWIEDQAPNNGDGNGDGIPDSQQGHVTSVPGLKPNTFLTVEVQDHKAENICGQIRGIMPVSNDALPEDKGYDHPFGNLSILLQCPSIAGGSATIRIYYHGASDMDVFVYRKFGPTKPNGLPVWYTYKDAKFGRTRVGGKNVQYVDLTLADNTLGDFLWNDYSSDGFILDPGGPAKRQVKEEVAIPTMSQWGLIIMSVLFVLSVLYMRRCGHI
jgi:hypothetical protein